jgi:23S rRNA (uracil1939-C5)-methyltransferase
VGFYAPGTHTVVDMERCPLCHDKLNAALHRLRSVSFEGAVELVANPESDDVLVWTRQPEPALQKVFPVAGSLRDKKPFYFLFDGVPIVNGAFSQSSLLLNRVLVRTVHEMIGDADRVLDLYCGNGNFSLGLQREGQILGLDHNPAAIGAANELRPGQYRVGDETAFCKALKERWDVVLLDPPRTGAKPIVEDLARCSATAIVYVSCDPATLARDLKVLAAQTWRVVRVVAVDMFPNTAHVETVCRLER